MNVKSQLFTVLLCTSFVASEILPQNINAKVNDLFMLERVDHLRATLEPLILSTISANVSDSNPALLTSFNKVTNLSVAVQLSLRLRGLSEIEWKKMQRYPSIFLTLRKN
jgi:BioD-like phosphotransacetylase family protein